MLLTPDAFTCIGIFNAGTPDLGQVPLETREITSSPGQGTGQGDNCLSGRYGKCFSGTFRLPKMRFSAREGWTIIRACHAGPKEEEID